MNKKILCIIPLGFLVASCANESLKTVQTCVPHNIPPKCVNNAGMGTTPFVNANPNNLGGLNPQNVCVKPGDTLEIRLPESTALGAVATVPKNLENFWLVAVNSVDNALISLKVPDPLPVGKYDYSVLTEGGGCLDPRFTVK